MTARGRSLLACLVLLALLAAGLFALPLPYVVLEPGPAIDTLGAQADVKINPSTAVDPTTTTGHLRLTTVAVSGGNTDVTVFSVVKGWISGSDAVVPRVVIYPPEKTVKQTEAESTMEMAQSQSSAVTAALGEIGPVVVKDFSAGSKAAGPLAVGDTITAVDGTATQDVPDLRAALSSKPVGQPVTVSYTRGGTPGTAQVPLVAAASGSGAALGIDVSPRTDVTATVGLQDVGGPSAGLMLALALVDKLTPGDLTGGRDIAGTGTIDDDGTVGEIGGIQQKLAGAREVGSTVFLVPAGNCPEAKKAVPDGLRLIKISTDPGVGLHQAHTYLEQVAAGRTDQPGC